MIRKGELLVAGPLDIDDDMQRMVLRNGEATAKGGHALQWLLQLAETRRNPLRSGTAARSGASRSSSPRPTTVRPFPSICSSCVRAGVAISDDMLLCIDALRWGQSDCTAWCPTATGGEFLRKGGDRPVGPQVARGAVTTGRVGA